MTKRTPFWLNCHQPVRGTLAIAIDPRRRCRLFGAMPDCFLLAVSETPVPEPAVWVRNRADSPACDEGESVRFPTASYVTYFSVLGSGRTGLSRARTPGTRIMRDSAGAAAG